MLALAASSVGMRLMASTRKRPWGWLKKVPSRRAGSVAAIGNWLASNAATAANLYRYVLGDPVNHFDVAGLGLDTLRASCLRSPQLCTALAAEGVLPAETGGPEGAAVEAVALVENLEAAMEGWCPE